MKKLNLLLIIALVIFSYSCDKEPIEIQVSLAEVNGHVQKGPFINGTLITVNELTDELTATGKNYATQIQDKTGTFQLTNVDLISEYVELRANGFYFNEVSNESSTAQLTLYALSDLSNKSNLNVNILSSLEKGRIQYLVSNGTDFAEAKKQALSEILSIFEIRNDEISESELLDISQTGDGNAILLAVSVMFQGYLSVSELSELIANVSSDIREDGELNNQLLGTTLINNAKTIRLDEIRSNLERRYKELGLQVSVPDFEKFVNQFIENTNFEYTCMIKYPPNGLYGPNFLDKNRTEYSVGYSSLHAVLPKGTSVKVRIQGRNWFYSISQDWSGWKKSRWDSFDNSRTFTSVKVGEIDFELQLEHVEQVKNTTIYVYENGDTEPTWSKEITIKNE